MFFSPNHAETQEAIDLAFSRTRAVDRKSWLEGKKGYNPKGPKFLDMQHTNKSSYKEFVDTELVQFSFADNMRSIPSAIDGLKVSFYLFILIYFLNLLSRTNNK